MLNGFKNELQDGCIDFEEFVVMMKKGDVGVGGRIMRGNLNFNLVDVFGVNEAVLDFS